jgi:carbon starvation protein CstA
LPPSWNQLGIQEVLSCHCLIFLSLFIVMGLSSCRYKLSAFALHVFVCLQQASKASNAFWPGMDESYFGGPGVADKGETRG